jgi:hypothetical protein
MNDPASVAGRDDAAGSRQALDIVHSWTRVSGVPRVTDGLSGGLSCPLPPPAGQGMARCGYPLDDDLGCFPLPPGVG